MKVEVDFSLDSNTLVVLYGIEYWVIQKSHATLNYCDGTANSKIAALYQKQVKYSINSRKVEVISIEEELRQCHVRWFCCVS